MRELSQRAVTGRRNLIFGVVLFAFVFLIFGFVRLQVVNRDRYEQQSLNNTIRAIMIYPVRGLIKDRNQRILVENRPAFSVAVIPKTVSDSTLNYLAARFDLDLTKLKQKIKRNFGFRPLVIAHDVPDEILIELEERKLDFPGVLTLVDSKRYYPPGVRSPHIFGNIGEVSQVEQLVNPVYKAGDLVGKNGLEKNYDLVLRGTKGVRYLKVDANGRELGDYDPDRNLPPIHGNDLYLYMDYELQSFADSLFEDKRGALVALDTRTGGVLALVSKPDYDPRLLSGRINPNEWKKLVNNPDHPLFNRALQSTYPPGSTYKLVAALAALQENIITPNWTAFCPGYFRLGRKIIHCWNKAGHGNINLLQAIRGSCNVYFYQLGLKIGLPIWSKYSRKLGFGSLTGIDLPNEFPGLVPSIAYFNKVYGEHGWTKGNLANLAIGQGELLVTPVQMAVFTMIIANKGLYHPPHLVDAMYDYTAHKMVKFPIKTNYVDGISDRVYDVVREGMRRVVDGGTGWRGKVRGIEMAGKTGTAQNPHGDDHAWFISFAPFDKPEIAVAAIVENGGSGGGVAAPLVRKFLEKYFYGRELPRPVAKPDTSNVQENPVAPFLTESLNPMPITLPVDSL